MEKNTVRIGINTMDPKHWLVIKKQVHTLNNRSIGSESWIKIRTSTNPGLHGSQSFSGSGSSTQPPVLRIRNVYPCFRIKLFLSRIPDPNFLHPGSTSKYFNSKKLFFKLTDIWSGFFIDADPDFYPSRIQGFKRHRIPDAPHWQPHYKVQIIIITKKVNGLFASRAANADP
jgi:hypothetical protein